VEDKDLHNLLNRPSVPCGLEKAIRVNWKQQLVRPAETRGWMHGRWALAGVASFVIVLVVLGVTFQTPSVVKAAYADIAKDKAHNVGITVPEETWRSALGIDTPARMAAVDMTKYCTIQGHKTLHFQVSGLQRNQSEKSEVHFFVQRGQFAKRFWQKSDGAFQSMPWRLIRPRPNLSVLVMYSEHADPNRVERLIRAMFVA
jgi:hypothetical protein